MIKTSLHSILGLIFGIGCSSDTPTPRAKVTVAKNEDEQIFLNLRSQQNTLQVFEVNAEDLSPTIVAQLQNPDKSIATGNLLRSPCLQEWYEGFTINQSIQKGECKKSLDWLLTVDASFSEKMTVDDILFSFVSPGPFIPSLDSESVSVIVEPGQLNTDLLHMRMNDLLNQSIDVRLYVEMNSNLYEMDFKCARKGQNMSDILEDDGCIHHTIEDISHPIQQAAMNQPKPIWLIQGYRVSGFQSIGQFNRMLKLP